MEKKKIILITDGDLIAKDVVEEVAKKIGGRCISLSAGNPTRLLGWEIVDLIKQTPKDPVLVMLDDNGDTKKGKGEKALEYIVRHPDIEVIGVVAVASNTKYVDGILVNCSIDHNGKIIKESVNKEGVKIKNSNKIFGDTVDVLNKLDIPIIVGVGDIGKMNGKDKKKIGAPITYKAIKIILERSNIV
ncbi:MAG: stage V sporulation protein AE [Vulcanibacillus sp.]